MTGTNFTEFGQTSEPVVGLMTEWLSGNELEHRRAEGDLGGTMRLGPYRADLNHGSRVAEIYGGAQISVARSRSTAMPAVAILSVD